MLTQASGRTLFNVIRFMSLGLVFTAAIGPRARAEVKLPPAISDHMVLQRELADPIWGTAEAGEEITVSIADQSKSTKADEKGKWMVKLDPLKGGEALTLTIKGKNTITIHDVLVGEVWVGSGQSNMDMQVKSYTAHDPVLEKAVSVPYPKLRLLSRGAKGWVEATPENEVNFSALLFSFGFRLHQELDVPVGLIVGAIGGTPSGMWLSEDAYRSDAACKEVAQKFAQTYPLEQLQKKYNEDLPRWKEAEAAAKAEKKPVPRAPVPPGKPGEMTGAKIGFLYEAHMRPFMPYGIRGVLWDQGESGTAITGVDQYTLMGALIAGWRKEWGQGDFPFLYIQKPSGDGCAWDPANPVTNKASPFAALPPTVPNDGAYRETHIKIMHYPNTTMVISNDLGSGTHPTNKSGYGDRACRVALGAVYGKPVEFYGPLYESHQVEDGKVRVKFTHVGQGLAPKHSEKVQGFALAGEDKVFHWADASIDGASVVLSCPAVPKPVALRYGWSAHNAWANLFNKDTLPAIPFRTDSW